MQTVKAADVASKSGLRVHYSANELPAPAQGPSAQCVQIPQNSSGSSAPPQSSQQNTGVHKSAVGIVPPPSAVSSYCISAQPACNKLTLCRAAAPTQPRETIREAVYLPLDILVTGVTVTLQWRSSSAPFSVFTQPPSHD